VRQALKKRNHCEKHELHDKETIHWVRSIEQTASVLDGQRAWFQLDREGDPYWTLNALHHSGQWFTVPWTYGPDPAGDHCMWSTLENSSAYR
jgi:hypothetical protein